MALNISKARDDPVTAADNNAEVYDKTISNYLKQS